MTKKKLPKSIRKYLRKEKARIRKYFSDSEEQDKLIKELLERYKNDNNVPQRSSR